MSTQIGKHSISIGKGQYGLVCCSGLTTSICDGCIEALIEKYGFMFLYSSLISDRFYEFVSAHPELSELLLSAIGYYGDLGRTDRAMALLAKIPSGAEIPDDLFDSTLTALCKHSDADSILRIITAFDSAGYSICAETYRTLLETYRTLLVEGYRLANDSYFELVLRLMDLLRSKGEAVEINLLKEAVRCGNQRYVTRFTTEHEIDPINLRTCTNLAKSFRHKGGYWKDNFVHLDGLMRKLSAEQTACLKREDARIAEEDRASKARIAARRAKALENSAASH